MPGIALYPRDNWTNHGQIDLIVAPVQYLVGIRQRRLAVHTARRRGSDRLIGIAGQRSPAALATDAASAWSAACRLLRSVGLLRFRRRQARIVRGFQRITQLGFKLGNPTLGLFKPMPQRKDQRILLGVVQSAEVGKLGHPKLESSRP